MKKLIKKVKEWFAIRKANKELDDAIIAAETMFRMTGKRHYVIADNKNRLRVFTWSQLKQMKKQGLFSATVKENDFIKESFYYTPYSLEHTYMKPETKDKKRKMWIAYYKAFRM